MATAEEPSVLEENPNTTTETTAAGSPGSMSAIVIGGTGAVGASLVGLLLKEKEKFSKITVIGRRKIDGIPDQYGVNIQEEEASGRLVQVEQDMESGDDEEIQRVCTGGDVFFCCLGTTRSAAGSAERFHQIDYGIPLKFAKAAKAAGVSHYSLVTSWGANARSIFLYLRTKGEIEDAVIGLKFNYTTILRPGAINRGDRATTGQKIAAFLLRPITTDTIAEAMIIDAYNRHTSPKNEGDPSTLIMNNSMMYQTIQRNQSSIGSSVDPPQESGKSKKEVEEVTEVTGEEDDGGDGAWKKEVTTDTTQPEEQQEQTTKEEEQQPVVLEQEQPSEDKEEQPTEEQPTEEQPTEEQPTEEQPTEEQPTEEQPTEEQPTEEQPTEEQPTKEQPTEEQPKPTEEQPTEEQPIEKEQEQPTEEQSTESQQDQPVED